MSAIAREKYTKHGKSNKRRSKYLQLLLSSLGFMMVFCDYSQTYEGIYMLIIIYYVQGWNYSVHVYVCMHLWINITTWFIPEKRFLHAAKYGDVSGLKKVSFLSI